MTLFYCPRKQQSVCQVWWGRNKSLPQGKVLASSGSNTLKFAIKETAGNDGLDMQDGGGDQEGTRRHQVTPKLITNLIPDRSPVHPKHVKQTWTSFKNGIWNDSWLTPECPTSTLSRTFSVNRSHFFFLMIKMAFMNVDTRAPWRFLILPIHRSFISSIWFEWW